MRAKDNSSRVGKNIITVYMGRIISLLVNLWVTITFANYLGESQFGDFSFALAFVGIFDAIINFGTNQVVVKEMAAEPDQTPAILGTVLIFRSLLIFANTLIGIAVGWGLNYPPSIILLLLIFYSNFIFSSRLTSLRKAIENTFEAKIQMPIIVLLQVLDSFLLAIGCYFAIQYHANLIQLAILYSLSNVPGTLILGVLIFYFWRLTPTFSWRHMKKIIKLGFPLLLFGFFSTLNTRIDVILIEQFRGNAEVGLYAAATRLIYPIVFIVNSLSISFLPLLASYNKKKDARFTPTFILGLKILLLMGCIISFTLFAHADLFINMLYTPNYRASIPAFSVLGVALFFVIFNFYFIDFLIVLNKQSRATQIMAGVASFNILINLYLIPKFGFFAASVSSLLSYGLAFFFLTIVSFGYAKIQWMKTSTKYIFFVAGFVFISYLIKDLQIALSISLALFALVSLSFFFKVINRYEVSLLKNFFNR
ncbi:MAG: flippase [Calditrichaeota bacterium]|nr:MAG: flippase [Calditrichota bacterium]